MKDESTSKERLLRALPLFLLALGVFGACMAFFWHVHPLIMFDTDDWKYASQARPPIPLPEEWNPTRVFPEVLMPGVASFSAWIIAPLTGLDWLDALTFTNALAGSAMVTFYVMLFERVAERIGGAARWQGTCLAIVFFALHFLAVEDGDHMLRSVDLTSFYYYTMSDLLCCSAVLWLMLSDPLVSWKQLGTAKKGVLVLLLYFALLSNLFASAILAVWVGCCLVSDAVSQLRSGNFHAKEFASVNAARMVVLVLWLAIQVLEVAGGRAESLECDASLFSLIGSTLDHLAGVELSEALLLVLIVSFAACVMAAAISRAREGAFRAPDGPPIARLLCAAALLGAYLVLVCAKASPFYIARPDVYFGVFFFIVVAALFSLARAASRLPQIGVAFPLAAALLACTAFSAWPWLGETNVGNLPPGTTEAITRDITAQVVAAEKTGEDQVEVRVPCFDASDNWPLATYAGERGSISCTLRAFGVTDREIRVALVPDDAKSAELGLLPS